MPATSTSENFAFINYICFFDGIMQVLMTTHLFRHSRPKKS